MHYVMHYVSPAADVSMERKVQSSALPTIWPRRVTNGLRRASGVTCAFCMYLNMHNGHGHGHGLDMDMPMDMDMHMPVHMHMPMHMHMHMAIGLL